MLYCRNELEADYIGMLLLAAAGFDPYGAPMFYDKMGKIKGESLLTNFLTCILFQVHPSSKKRSRLLLQPKVMEEAMELYREVTSDGQGYDKDLDSLS
jgi:predicted Zn-dependent protease